MAKRYKLKEATVRLVLKDGNEPLYRPKSIRTSEDAVEAVADYLRELDREHVVIINLDSKSRPINYHVASVGGISNSVFDVPSIFKTAILSNASRIIMLHNHPSGDLETSAADLAATERVIEAGKLLQIDLLDHIIVSSGIFGFKSIREEKPFLAWN